MRSTKYRESGPVKSQARRGPRPSPPRSHDTGHLVPPPVYNVWDAHGGVHFSNELDPVTQKRIPDYVVATVGYAHDEPNEFDFDEIQAAIRALSELLRFEDGSIAYKRGSQNETYLPSKISLVVIHQGTYETSGISFGTWLQLVADGDVTIRGVGAGLHVIRVGSVSGTDATLPTPKIGGAFTVSVSGTFRLEPSAGSTDQRGIVCEQGARLDVEGTTFSSFRSRGSGAAIVGFLGTATNCIFENCVASDATASGGAISGVTEPGLGIVVGRKVTYLYSRANLVKCIFTNCAAGFNGGAVEQVGVVVECAFTDCSATSGSGGACHDVTRVRVSTFDRCRANTDGGALSDIEGWTDFYFPNDAIGYDDRFFVESCRFTGCTASRGGAIANAKVNVSQCFFDRNVATGPGGGGLYKVTHDIDRCSITRNRAVAAPGKKKKPREHMGGGLHSCSGKITNCIVAANHAGEDGGGLFNCDGALWHLDILQNKADGLGGGARSCSGKIQNCIILGNWSLKSRPRDDSNQISNCSDPKYCFLPKGWSGGGSDNVKDRDGSGPGFLTPLPILQDQDRATEDPTTWDYFQILDGFDARRLSLTSASKDKGLLDSGKNLGVDRDFENLRRPNPVDAKRPDIGAFESVPQ